MKEPEHISTVIGRFLDLHRIKPHNRTMDKSNPKKSQYDQYMEAVSQKEHLHNIQQQIAEFERRLSDETPVESFGFGGKVLTFKPGVKDWKSDKVRQKANIQKRNDDIKRLMDGLAKVPDDFGHEEPITFPIKPPRG
jgi:uncharacterized protein YaaR (DUF327 family)